MFPVGMGTFHQRKFKGCSFDYFSMIMLCEMKQWYPLIRYPLILVCILTMFCGCMPSDHVIMSQIRDKLYVIVHIQFPL